MSTLPKPPTHQRQSRGGRGRFHFDTLLTCFVLASFVPAFFAARRSRRFSDVEDDPAGGAGGAGGAPLEARSVDVVADRFVGGTASLTSPR